MMVIRCNSCGSASIQDNKCSHCGSTVGGNVAKSIHRSEDDGGGAGMAVLGAITAIILFLGALALVSLLQGDTLSPLSTMPHDIIINDIMIKMSGAIRPVSIFLVIMTVFITFGLAIIKGDIYAILPLVFIGVIIIIVSSYSTSLLDGIKGESTSSVTETDKAKGM